MNAIQLKDRVLFLVDDTGAARFSPTTIDKAVNDSIKVFVDTMIGDIEDKNSYSIQSDQQVSDNLQPLVKSGAMTMGGGGTTVTKAGSITSSSFTMPTDYYRLIRIKNTINGFSTGSKRLSYSKIDAYLENIHLIPRGVKNYFIEFATGITIYHVYGGTLNQCILVYIKTPDTYTCGKASQVITEAVAVLTIGLSYIALEDGTVESSVTYNSGTVFTAASVNLTTGAVILASNTTPTNLPDKVHETIAKLASVELKKIIGDYQSASAIESELKKNN